MRAPSAKNLQKELRIGAAEARLVRRLAAAVDDGEKLRKLIEKHCPRTARERMYGDPYNSHMWRVTMALRGMDEAVGTHGVEALGNRFSTQAPPYEYLNSGDMYDATLIYQRSPERLFIGSPGDIVEREDRNEEW